MCPPANHECVGVNDSWIRQIILWLLNDFVALTGWMWWELFLTFLLLCRSLSLPIFSFPHHLIMIVPVSLDCVQHGVKRKWQISQCSLSFLLKLLFCPVFKVSVLLERISALYQQDSVIPTSLLCLPELITVWTRGAFRLVHIKKPRTFCMRLEPNWNSTWMRNQGKFTLGLEAVTLVWQHLLNIWIHLVKALLYSCRIFYSISQKNFLLKYII